MSKPVQDIKQILADVKTQSAWQKVDSIGQYKIQQWVRSQFEPNCVTMTFNGDSAIITDKDGNSMEVAYSPDKGVYVKGYIIK